MNINRRPVTLRLNLQEQQDVASLVEFFTKPGMRPTEKDIFKIALSMLIDSRDQLKRQQAAKATAEQEQCDTQSSSSSEPSLGDSQPTT